MKYLFSSFLIGTCLICCTSKKPSETGKADTKTTWSKEQATKHLAYRNDASTWDATMLENDLEYVDMRAMLGLPITNGVFPTPKYDLLGKGSFKGVGNYACLGGDCEKRIEDKTILYNSFFARKNKFNQRFIEDREDEIFFQIVVLTDNIDTTNYSHHSGEVVSRNHPDYICQGCFKTRQNKIDYTAFITANRNAYAVVNMRLFDLRHGKTILIAPQKDKSLRSMQIQSPILSSKEVDAYTDRLLKEESVFDFFMKDGTIGSI